VVCSVQTFIFELAALRVVTREMKIQSPEKAPICIPLNTKKLRI